VFEDKLKSNLKVSIIPEKYTPFVTVKMEYDM